ncbi:WcaG Nucleoside-diphosphate-sugar epimerases [uncultured Caudovirales phage]|uniref:WcaG Nucleoside-diphosphate-sugar epimerases n=1 Tax=uncultured Caudovirales phage TaxID=2100421 RepID=A0A6J5KPH5_9CAUD|nr:WcaG Nucleoside-diphosphate-sugar epimerases [uncultured Caudovirales phage]
MNYLIAGGAGFLGSHLTKRLLSEGHNVTIIDNLCTGQRSNLKEFIPNRNFNFIADDITRINAGNHFNDIRFAGIFNLACPASPIHYQNIPIETTLTCVVGTNNLLELAKKHECRILQASTSEVYGDPEVSPQPETYVGHVNSYGPRSCYDEGKRAAEALFYDYKRIHQVDTRIIRIFNTYGPNMCVDDGRVVSNFIVQALRGDNITIYGDGSQTRSFCFASDLIDGMLAVYNSNITTPVNVGNPGEFTILELAEKVLKITGSKSKLRFLPLPKDDPTQRCPDITLAKSLNWLPKILLDEGLPYTVEYFSGKLK